MLRRRQRVHLLASRVHKWLALLIGLQVLIWFASGTLMSFLPIERVRGEHLVDRSATPLPAGAGLANPAMLLARAESPVEGMAWRMLLDRPVAELTTAKGVQLFDGATGVSLPPVDAVTAGKIARRGWKGDPATSAMTSPVVRESPEYRGSLPAWRVAFADPDATSVFVAADSGRITAVRTGTWRLYDFFWSLHIMDWKEHENFNTPWLLAFAIGGLAFGLTGTVLLVMRWPLALRRKRRTSP